MYKKNLKYDWYFFKGDIEDFTGDYIPDNFRKIRVPHDSGIEGEFDLNNDIQITEVIADGIIEKTKLIGRTGALPFTGKSWYIRKEFINKSFCGKRIFLDFDGVMQNSTVYVNGKKVGFRPYGYSSFSYEITDYVKFGEENYIAVSVNVEPISSRWYPGAGIYRHAYLRVENPIHISKNGVYITSEINKNEANINAAIDIDGDATGCTVISKIVDGNKEIVSCTTDVNSNTINQKFILDNYKLWDIEDANLYTLVTKIYKSNKEISAVETKFGIREIAFDKDNGFFLNGINVKLKGVCMHHDLGALGTAINVRAIQRQLEILQEMGCNAIRTSHNPPAPELLDLCDRMGFLVIDEAFDEWKYAKVENGYRKYFDEWAKRDLEDMIKRDRNHPSIIMWSIGNEILDQCYEDGKYTARMLTGICHNMDNTRPTTAGFNMHEEALKNKLPHEVDIPGFNYKPHLYKQFKKDYPNWIMYGSETESCCSSRGVYHFPCEVQYPAVLNDDNHCTSYDVVGPKWACSPDTEFEAQDENKNILGEFVWTGFDYLGEPTPYNKGGSRSSYFGIVDLCGIPKDRYYSYKAKWTDEDVLHIFPNWNFEDRIGEVVPVHAYTNYSKGEVFVNGVSQGIAKKSNENAFSKNRLMWQNVIYEPGEIKVVVYDDNDKPAMEKIVKTASAPAKIMLKPDRETIQADGDDLCFITIETVDENGNLCPCANNTMHIDVQGAGELIAVDNGDQTSLKSFKRDNVELFSGRAIAIVRSVKDVVGEVVVNVNSEGMHSALLVISVK